MNILRACSNSLQKGLLLASMGLDMCPEHKRPKVMLMTAEALNSKSPSAVTLLITRVPSPALSRSLFSFVTVHVMVQLKS